MPKATYTLEQIKAAYWYVFYKSGEWYFAPPEEDGEEMMPIYYAEFVEALDRAVRNTQSEETDRPTPGGV